MSTSCGVRKVLSAFHFCCHFFSISVNGYVEAAPELSSDSVSAVAVILSPPLQINDGRNPSVGNAGAARLKLSLDARRPRLATERS
jgi:hypothetical protein